MPSVSKKQRRFFGWLEHAPMYQLNAAQKKTRKTMGHQALHDFAATKEKGLPLRKKRKSR